MLEKPKQNETHLPFLPCYKINIYHLHSFLGKFLYLPFSTFKECAQILYLHNTDFSRFDNRFLRYFCKQNLSTISLYTIHLEDFSKTLKQLCINASVRRCSTRNEKCLTSQTSCCSQKCPRPKNKVHS